MNQLSQMFNNKLISFEHLERGSVDKLVSRKTPVLRGGKLIEHLFLKIKLKSI